MRTVFADAGYWIALFHPRDFLHEKAVAVSAALGPVRVVTSEMVLAEWLNDYAARGEALRTIAVTFIRRLHQDEDTTIVPQTRAQFQEALSLYAEREDQSWSLTDCASFRIMGDFGISDALTHDQHFVQAGFTAMLREGP